MALLPFYNLLAHLTIVPLLAGFYGPSILLGKKYRESVRGKLGILPEGFPLPTRTRPCWWFHAVSVGEAAALAPVVRETARMNPNAEIYVSTGTETGQAKARASIPEARGFLYLPLDLPECVNPVVNAIRPDVFVLMETELWPNLIHALARRGVRILLANARISDRSFPRYRKLRRLFGSTLEKIDLCFASSPLDAERLKAIGIPQDRIIVAGNTKYDCLFEGGNMPDALSIRTRLGIGPTAPVFLVGSSHPGENEIMIHAYIELKQEFPDLVLVITPRHVERAPEIVRAALDAGLPRPVLLTDLENGRSGPHDGPVIIDKTGELFRLYSIADLVFVGGSLAPKGGQNILEPAALSKPVLFGPHMEDFREAERLLIGCGAGIRVENVGDITRHGRNLLGNPRFSEELGARGREAIGARAGASKLIARAIATQHDSRSLSRNLHQG